MRLVQAMSSVMHRLVGGKLMRCGYTTGTCAAAAAKAAVTMLITGTTVTTMSIDTPAGTSLVLDILDAKVESGVASCAVRKDGGDDPDATNGALIYATVNRIPSGVVIDGGKGIGRVTKDGLDQPVGEAAINSVPRRMITQAIAQVADESDEPSGWKVIISCPTGEEIATKTFNPKLGVTGGISILGTTGIVEPMSNTALIETTDREISILAAAGKKELLIVIGNYGEAFARANLGLDTSGASGIAPTKEMDTSYGSVKSSNFIGDAIDSAVEHGFESLLLVGHIGKMVKLGVGMLNTHSSQGDGRLETVIACALAAGADIDLLHQLQDCATSEAALRLLDSAGFLMSTMEILNDRIQQTLNRRVPQGVQMEWITFATLDGSYTRVAGSPHVTDIIERWRQP